MSQQKVNWIHEAVEKYQAKLINYTRKFVGNLEKAKEIVQEAFLRLWKQEQEKIKGHLAPWLFTVCRNLALDYLRKEQKMKLEEDMSWHSDSKPSPELNMHEQEQFIQVNQEMKKLSPKQQEVITLKFQNGLSYKEISQVTGLSVSNVGYLIHTGVQEMKTSLEQHGGIQ